MAIDPRKLRPTELCRLFNSTPLTAEIKTEEFLAGKGLVTRWERIRQQNHWLDALYNACAAGHLSGARLLDAPVNTPRPRRKYGVLSDVASVNAYDTQRWREMTDRWWS